LYSSSLTCSSPIIRLGSAWVMTPSYLPFPLYFKSFDFHYSPHSLSSPASLFVAIQFW
jgi:hypothetical protein